MPEQEQAAWKRLHGVIRRATDERVSERYLDFRAMAAALSGTVEVPSPQHRKGHRPAVAVALVLLTLAAVTTITIHRHRKANQTPSETVSGEKTSAESATPGPSATSTPRKPKIVDMRGHFKSVRERVIEVLPAAVAPPRDGRVRLDLNERGETVAILKSYEARDYEKCLELLDKRTAAYPKLRDSRLFLLVRALTLKHLNRTDNLASLRKQIETPPVSGSMAELNAELTLLESLGWFSSGENLVSAVIKILPDTVKTSDLITLYNQRARFRILGENHAGALADEHATLALPPMQYPGVPRSEKEAAQIHLNTTVMQWELLGQEFPAYDSYLEANGSPEPKPDHRKHPAED